MPETFVRLRRILLPPLVCVMWMRDMRRKRSLPREWFFLRFAALVLAAAGVVRAEEVALFPLDQVQAGQEGVWRTVVKGNEIREFKLRILGVVQDFIGPQQPGIIAEAVDPENVLSGPVGGMSGSPVYIEGKLVGAYAYGYTWPKEQAIIGITPIEQMLALLDYSETPPGSLQRVPGLTSPSGGDLPSARPIGQGGQVSPGLTQLPTPLSFSGFSQQTVEAFREELALFGFSGAISPIGQRESVELNLRPGAPIAGVLMSGDFNVAATGTITWVDGERFLAFGHPFLQSGTVAMPMAGAEIVTVVRSVQSSFKLANVGLPAGRITQDRMPGVAGRRGDVPLMAEVSIGVNWDGKRTERFSSQVWTHPQLLPMMVGMATMQSLTEAASGENRQTVKLRAEVTVRNGDVVPVQSVTTGPSAVSATARNMFERLQEVLDNPFGPLTVERIDISVEVLPGWEASVLREVIVGDARPRAGEPLPITLSLLDHWGELRRLTVDVPLPERARPGDRFQIMVLDAREANRLLGKGAPARSADSLAGWLRPLLEMRSDGALYVFLVAGEDGMEVSGQRLHQLPPSVSASLGSPATRFVDAPILPRVIWEKQIPLGGAFSGSDAFTLVLE